MIVFRSRVVFNISILCKEAGFIFNPEYMNSPCRLVSLVGLDASVELSNLSPAGGILGVGFIYPDGGGGGV